MAFVLADRVKQLTATTGTGTYTLTSTPTGYQDFDVGIGTGNTCYYVAIAGNDWEVGVGTVTVSGATIQVARSVFKSTNSDSVVSWGVGNKEIFVVSPADALSMLRISGGDQSIVITGGGNTITLAPAGTSAVQGGLDVTGTLTVDAITVGGTAPVLSTRQVISGSGLTGGGDLSADRTLAVGAGSGITVAADTVLLDTTSERNIDHSGVTLTAGDGLTGGGTISASRTFTVGAGSGISVSSDAVAVDTTVIRTTGAQTIAGVKNFTPDTPTIGGVAIATVATVTAQTVYAGYVDASVAAEVLPSGWTVSSPGTGRYLITHSLALAAITDLSIIVTPIVASSDDRFAIVDSSALGVNSFEVRIIDVGSGIVNNAFFFLAKKNV